jgi:hypothetical protein
MKKTLVLMLLALCPLLAFPQAMKAGPKETMWARVTLHVAWNIRNEDSGEVEVTQGVLHLTMNGTLKLNREYSGIRHAGRATPLLAYTLKDFTFNVMYKDAHSFFSPENPPKCSNPQTTFDKQASVNGDSRDEPPVNLFIHYLAGIGMLQPDRTPPAVKDRLIDYYEFDVRVPYQKIDGQSQEFDYTSKKCSPHPQTRTIDDDDIRIYYMFGEGHTLAGSKSWTSHSDHPPGFFAEVSDLPAVFKRKPARPEPGGKNDVQYTLSWDLDSSPVAEIERERYGGLWYDVTGVDQEVAVGDVIHLRGLVSPRSLDTGKGKWDFSPWSDDFAIPLILTNELAFTAPQNLREFEVTYTTKAGGQDVSAKVTFKVKKNSGDSKIP